MEEKRPNAIQELKEALATYTIEELSEALSISTKTLLSYCRSGRLRASKLAGRWVITRENALRLVNGE